MTTSIRTSWGDIALNDGVLNYFYEAFRNAPDEDACYEAVRDYIISYGERVAIIRTRRGKAPTVLGYATISGAEFWTVAELDERRDLTLIPEGSQYDCKDRGKWCYRMTDAETCDPFPLPADAVRHGRSWCEF